MLETEFLFFQGMKKRIDQRISEGNYDEAAVSMQKCMEYILNSLDGRNNDYQKVCVLFEVQARVMENHPQYPFYWHEWETVIKYCDQQMHLQGKPIDLEQLKSDTVIAHQMFEKIVQDYLNHGDSVISNILLSAVMIAAITEMEEKDRNMVEIATIFRLGVSGIMLDKILHVMFDEIDISHPGKKLFEIYSEAPVGIKLYAIQRVADALKVYEDYISENFKLHQYDMAMPIKQKCVLFVTPGKTAQDKVLFSSFMEKLYDMMIAAADLNPKHPKVQVDLFDYPLHGVIEGLDDYMKYGNDKGIYTTLYTECKDIETIDQEECMEHINEIYDHCKIDILIEDTDSSLHYTHKCGNTTIGEEPEIPGMSCHSNDPKYREIIKCKDNEDAIECHCYMYRSENHPYPIPENTEDLLTMYSKRR